MNESLSSDLAKELLTFLAYSDENFKASIPKHFIEDLTDLAADSDKDFFIEGDKSLTEQNLSEECRDLISLLYYNSVEPNKKEELLNSWIKKVEGD